MRLRTFLCFFLLGLCVVSSLSAQSHLSAASAARAYTAAHGSELTAGFETFLAIPNVAADPAGLERNAALLVSELKSAARRRNC